jgi:hypothetical protein
MSVKNYYPELPEIIFQRTSVEMPSVVVFARSLLSKYSKDAVRMAYAIFRFESANGTKGVNNNYGGIQADVGRWKNLPGTPVATCVKVDSGGALRRFLCFSKEDGYKVSFELICVKATERKMVTVDDYFKQWVGNPNPGKDYKNSFKQVLEKAEIAIP